VAAARPTGVIELELIEQLEAIEPAAGITFRRDPILPPLLEEDRWIEWVLSVTLNGRRCPKVWSSSRSRAPAGSRSSSPPPRRGVW
jgi:hypothetical protein